MRRKILFGSAMDPAFNILWHTERRTYTMKIIILSDPWELRHKIGNLNINKERVFCFMHSGILMFFILKINQ